MKLQIKAGTTDFSVLVFIQDAASVSGAGKSGLAATHVDAYYCRIETDNDVAKGDVGINDLATILDAHADGGFIEIDAINLPGWYRLDLPDAVLAAGAWSAGVRLYDAGDNDVADCNLEIQLLAVDLLDAETGGMTEVATSTALATVDTNVDAILADTGTDGVKIASGAITATTIAASALDRKGDWSTHNAQDVVGEFGTGGTLTALAPAATALSTVTWTSTRAGYLDQLNALILPAVVDRIAQDTGTDIPATLATLATAAALATVDANVDLILEDTGTDGVVVASTSKAGYSLAATGLDAITADEPTGIPTTFVGWIMWLIQRFRRADKSTTEITVLSEAGATITTQAITDDGAGTETLGPPT